MWMCSTILIQFVHLSNGDWVLMGLYPDGLTVFIIFFPHQQAGVVFKDGQILQNKFMGLLVFSKARSHWYIQELNWQYFQIYVREHIIIYVIEKHILEVYISIKGYNFHSYSYNRPPWFCVNQFICIQHCHNQMKWDLLCYKTRVAITNQIRPDYNESNILPSFNAR